MLPDSFYLNAFGTHMHHAQLAALLELLTQSRESELRAHLDIERGVSLRQIIALPVGSKDRAFWDTKLPVLLAHLGITNSTMPCCVTWQCVQQPPAPCTCVIVRGNSGNVLDQFVNHFQGRTRYEVAQSLDESVRPEWIRLGAMIASWCCGDDILRA